MPCLALPPRLQRVARLTRWPKQLAETGLTSTFDQHWSLIVASNMNVENAIHPWQRSGQSFLQLPPGCSKRDQRQLTSRPETRQVQLAGRSHRVNEQALSRNQNCGGSQQRASSAGAARPRTKASWTDVVDGCGSPNFGGLLNCAMAPARGPWLRDSTSGRADAVLQCGHSNSHCRFVALGISNSLLWSAPPWRLGLGQSSVVRWRLLKLSCLAVCGCCAPRVTILQEAAREETSPCSVSDRSTRQSH